MKLGPSTVIKPEEFKLILAAGARPSRVLVARWLDRMTTDAPLGGIVIAKNGERLGVRLRKVREMTGYQIRMARNLLGWSLETVSDCSGLDLDLLSLAEAAEWRELLNMPQSIRLQRVMTKAGLVFSGSDIWLRNPEA